jgi:hypothetical protein
LSHIVAGCVRRRSLRYRTLPDHRGRDSRDRRVRPDVLHHHRTRAHLRPGADAQARRQLSEHDGVGPDHHIVTN